MSIIDQTMLTMLSSNVIDEELKESDLCRFSGNIVRIDTIKSKDSCLDKLEIYIIGETGIIKTKSIVKNSDCLVETTKFMFEDYKKLPKEGEQVEYMLSYTLKEKWLVSNKKINDAEYEVISGTKYTTQQTCKIDYSSLKSLPEGPGPNWTFVGIGAVFLIISLYFIISRLIKAVKFD